MLKPVHELTSFARAFLSKSILAGLLLSSFAFAQQGPTQLNISGGLFDSRGLPVTSAHVNFKLEILDPGGTCILYTEQHGNVDLSSSKGAFSLLLGTGSSAANNLEGGTALDAKIFANNGAVGAFPGCPSGTAMNPGDGRLIRVSYDLGSGYVPMSPNVPIVSSPYAMVAETLQGKHASDFLLANTNTSLQQANLEYLFTNTNYASLKALVDGTSSQYILAAPTAAVGFNSQRLTNVANPTAAQDAATKSYADSNLGGKTVDTTGIGPGIGGGRTIVWDSAQNKWVTSATGGVASVVAGSGLLGGNITTTGTLSVDVGTTANKILQLDASARLPAVDGSLLTNVSASYLLGRALAPVAPSAQQVLGWNATSLQWEPQTPSGGTITALTGDVSASGSGSVTATIQPNAVTSAKINNSGVAVNRLLITDATTGATVGYATCALNEVLQWTASGWACKPVALMLGNVNASVGTFGNATAVAQATVDAQGRITSITNVNIAFPVTSVAGRTGAVTLTSSDITGLGTAATQNVGVAANNVVQLDASAHLPAVDGSALTNLNLNGANATKIQSRNVSATAPGAGQVLAWNNLSSQWEPASAATGSVTSVVGGSGLLGGNITATGTLSVDVGTTANKILQLNASAQIPAVDGSLLTNVAAASGNATTLQARNVSAAAPGAGQVLGWNAATSVWEPVSTALGSVTSVASGTGLTGGPITGNGTLNVDVGTTANKILQLNASAQIPAVDGSLVTNVNAGKISGKVVSGNAPTAGQVLAYNSSTAQWEATASAVSSQWGTNGSDIYYNAGKVGIGTASPTQALEVFGQAQFDNRVFVLQNGFNSSAQNGLSILQQYSGSDGSALTMDHTVNGFGSLTNGDKIGQIDFKMADSTNTYIQTNQIRADVTNVTHNSVNTRLIFATTNNSTMADRMLIDGNGNVGIGTLTPNALLEVNGTLRVTTICDSTGANCKTVSGGWGAGGSVTNISAGTGLTGGNITTAGTLNVDVGTTANKILQLNASAQIPAIDGSLVTNVNAAKIGTRTVSSGAPAGGYVLTYNASSAQWEPAAVSASGSSWVNGGNTFGAASSLGNKDAFALSFITNNSPRMTIDGAGNVGIGTATPSLPLQVVAGNMNAFSASSNLGTAILGDGMSGGAPAIWGGSASAAGVIGVRGDSMSAQGVYGVTNGGYGVQGQANTGVGGYFTSTSGYGLIVGSGNVGIGTTTPNALLDVNGTMRVTTICDSTGANCKTVSSGWGAGGSVTNVSAGTGLTGGNITTAGTLNVDVGTTANKILQLNASAQIPAVDGSLLTNVNTTKLQTRALSSAAPGAGQFIGWNNSSSQWEPMSGNFGSVTSVSAGTGLTGGPITTNGTLNVDVGTGANKILQLNASAQIPAVDGSLVTNVNAGKISGKAVSASAPSAGQVLAYNSGTAQWEAASSVSSQWTTSGSNIYYSTGNVGIGTTTPATLLSLGGTPNSIANGISMGSGDFNLYQPASGQLTFRFGGVDRWYILGGQLYTDTGTGPGFFPVNNAVVRARYNEDTGLGRVGTDSLSLVTAGANRVVVDASGAVGIGTITPRAALEIANTTSGYSAILVPRDTTANRGAGVNGMIRYNTNTAAFEGFANGSWGSLAGAGGGSQWTTSGSNIYYNLGNVGIGTTTPVAKLDVTGNIAVNGTVLIKATTGASQNIFIGDTAGANDTVNANDIGIGYNTLAAVSGGSNSIAIGARSLQQQNGGGLNVSLGAMSLSSLTGGWQNSAYGYGAGLYLASGDNNTLIGDNAGAGYNLGFNSFRNTLVGAASGNSLQTSSNDNTSLGFQSAYDITTGSNNIMIGSYPTTAVGITTGSNNIMLGYDVRPPSQTASNQLNIGNLLYATALSSGSTVATTGLIGVGTPNPQAVLDLASTASGKSAILVPRDTTANRGPGVNGMIRYNTNTAAFEGFANGSWQNVALGGGGASQWTTNSPNIYYNLGNVGVGTSAPDAMLSLNASGGSAQAPNSGSMLHMTGPTNSSVALTMDAYGTNFYDSPYITLRKAHGTAGSPTATQTNDILGDVQMFGWTGSGWVNSASIEVDAIENYTGSASGSKMGFFVHKPGTNSNNGMTLTGNGLVIGSSGSLNMLDVYGGAAIGTGYIGLQTAPTNGLIVQGNVGVGTPSPVAALDITSTTSGQSAIIVPRDTTANRGTGVNGMIRYNTNSNAFEGFANGAWGSLAGGSGVASGASGAIQFSNGSSGFLSNTNLAWDNTNARFGIGTSAPKTTLTVQNTNSSTTLTNFTQSLTNGGINVTTNYGSGGVYGPGVFWSTADNNPTKPKVGIFPLMDGNGSTLVFGTSNLYTTGITNTGMAIDYNGNVGIGTLTAWGVGTGNLTALGEIATQSFFYNANTTSSDILLNSNGSNYGTIQNDTNNTWSLGYTPTGTSALGTNVLTWNSSGKVGIGNTNPQAVLDVTSTVSGQSAIILPRDTTANRGTGVNGMIRYNTNSNAFEGFANGAWGALSSGSGGVAGSNMAIQYNNSGAMGGSSDFSYDNTNHNLTVQDSLNDSNTSSFYFQKYRAGSAATVNDQVGAIRWRYYLGSSAWSEGASIRGEVDGTPSTSSGPGRILFSTTPVNSIAPVERMRIDNAGNVGIGTTTPQTKLQVAAGDITIDKSNYYLFGPTTSDGISVPAGGDVMTFRVWEGTAGGYNFTGSQFGGNYLYINLVGSNRGNVGIGTNTPQALLDLSTTTSGQSAVIVPRDTAANRPSTGVNGMIRYNTNSNAFEGFANGAWGALASGGSSQWTTNGSNIYYNTGNVGIGTTTPTKYFEIAPPGNAQANLGLRSSGGAGAKVYFGTDGVYANDYAGAIAFNAATTGGFEFRTTNGTGDVESSAADRMIITAAGNVGIGTTSTYNLLTIGQGGWNTSPRQAISILEQGYDFPSADTQSSNGDKLVLWNLNAVKNTIGVGPDSLWMQASGNSKSHLSFWTGPTAGAVPFERMRIDAYGNVGVGTAAPINTLSASPTYINTTWGASQSGNTVTGSGTSWTSAMVGMQFVYPQYAGGSLSAGIITAVNSATSLTVTTSQTVPTTWYSVSYSGLNVTSNGSVGVGTTTPNSKLEVNGSMRLDGATSGYVGLQAPASVGTPVTFTLPNGDGTNGQVLSTNGSGNLVWTNLSGSSAAMHPCEIHINGTGTNGVIQAGDADFVNCVNAFGGTMTVTSVQCFSDNSGSTTIQIATNGGTNLLSSAVTCSPTGATGTLNGSPLMVNQSWLTAPTITPDGTTKTLVIVIGRTL